MMRKKKREQYPDIEAAVKENGIDRAIRFVSPQWAARRRKARMALAVTDGFKGASKSRRALTSWSGSDGSADSVVNADLPDLRGRSRRLVMDNPIAAGAINTPTRHVVGTGITLNAQVDRAVLGLSEDEAQEFERNVERRFRLWEKECDIERHLTFSEMQALALRSTLESGDVFVILPYRQRTGEAYGLKLQIIEGDRVCNPHWKQDGRHRVTLKNGDTEDRIYSGGVELDVDGSPKRYHILKYHPGDLQIGKTERTWVAYAARQPSGRANVLHLFDKLRPGQHRGVPYLSPVIEPLKQLDRYTDAEIMAAVVSGLFTVFLKTETGDSLDPMAPTDETGATDSDDDVKLGYGAMVDLAQNEEVQFANPQRPNSQFDPFVTSCLRQIGAGLSLPYEVLVMHFESSYSAARAAMLMAWTFFRERRAWLVNHLCMPVYEAWMMEAVMRGDVYAPGFISDPFLRRAYLGAQWIGPSQMQIDPVKDVMAAEKRMDNKLTTHAEECTALTGGVWDEKLDRMRYEEQMLASLGGSGQE